MMKKLGASLLALALSALLALGCFAAQPSGTVVYNGSTLKVSGGMTGFSNILPGVGYNGSIQLENTSNATANFYMNTDVANTLQKQIDSDPDAGYTVSLVCGQNNLYGYDPAAGKATGSLIGGDGTSGLEELNGSLKGYLLVATLAPGAKADVLLSIQPDAQSMGNGYQNSVGQIDFQFQATTAPSEKVVNLVKQEKGETKVVTETRYLVQGAKTGDVALILLGTVLLLALVVLLLTRKKKKKKE